MSSAPASDGGYLVPTETETEIGKRLADLSPIRALRHRAPGFGRRVEEAVRHHRPGFRLGRRNGGAHRRPSAPTLAELQFPAMELYAMPAATQLAARRRRRRHRPVDRRRSRDGLRRAGGRGLRHRRRHQQAEGLPRLHQGRGKRLEPGAISATSPPASPARFPAADPSDVLVDLVYALKAGYRQNASWVMNRKLQASVRKLKDADGNYLWQPPAGVGQRPC